VPLVEALCERLKVPNVYRDLGVLTARHHALVHRAAELRANTVVKLLEMLDAFRRPDRFGEFLLACECDARGRTGLESRPYPQRDYLLRARDAAAAVTLTQEERQLLKGPVLGERLREKRLAAVTALKQDTFTQHPPVP